VLGKLAGGDELAVLGAADGLDDEEHPATAMRTISAAASWPARARGLRAAPRFPLS